MLLQRASQCGWNQTLRVLLDTYRVSPNLPPYGFSLTALHWTCNHIHYRCTALLLSRGALIEGNPGCVSTPLHYAARAGNSAVGVIRLLLSAGANINAADLRERKTALHIAALGGYSGVVSTLLEHGAKLDVKDSDGYQPLHYAAFHGFVRIVKLLLDAGADPNASTADRTEDTPLAWALMRQHPSVVRELMAGGADPRKCERAVERRTALSLAASLGYADMVELLLDFGASGEARDGEGRTSAEVANANGHKAVEYILLRWKDIEWAALRGRRQG
ncbi:ankyrin repeat-containing domain protein [Sphaerosporella brunnea]|uniref:Ankyrin repeat-containing domain protein n=1 Tax=Sphaerosporella brunnea TaxID=1250544 RepID=A0A5J5F9C5_9PEZI|nr:ankyrin repeat-containing domain protein [Sphaerosporella brunnea]